MRFNIICIGQKMPSWVVTAFHEYKKRFSSPFSVNLLEIPAKNRNSNATEKLMEIEAEKIFSYIPPGGFVIALDEGGQLWNTEKLSKKIAKWQLETSDIYFIIGGADGLSKQCLKKARECWSLSPLTFPHPLVRVILIEQLYRAVSIINHHPYHRA